MDAERLPGRSGTGGAGPGGQNWPVAHEEWIDDGNAVHAAVGSYRANAFGLHDVHGNVWEWCLDGHDGRFYRQAPAKDPLSPAAGLLARVVRGGSFYSAAVIARAADRHGGAPSIANSSLGLRPARAVAP